MMRRLLIGMAAAWHLAAPLHAEKAPDFANGKAVKDQPKVTLARDKAYILFRSDTAGGLFLTKIPDAADSAKWAALRATALAKARRRFDRDQAAYAAAVKQRAAGAPGSLPEKPVAPDDTNFEYQPFALMAGVAIGPRDRFAKTPAGASTYLTEVTPGDYRIYGPMIGLPNVAMSGVCFCMGSVRFSAHAGEIVDLGTMHLTATAPRSGGDAAAPADMSGFPILTPTVAAVPDPRLAAFRVVPAAYMIAGKAPNYFGTTIGRIAPLPGVFHYERDRMVPDR